MLRWQQDVLRALRDEIENLTGKVRSFTVGGVEPVTLRQCPNCHARYLTMQHSGDFVHKCSTAPEAIAAVKDEDVVVNFQFSEFGATTTPSPGDVRFAGVSDQLWGSDAFLEGGRFDPVTVRGKRKSTHRTREVYTYIP